MKEYIWYVYIDIRLSELEVTLF